MTGNLWGPNFTATKTRRVAAKTIIMTIVMSLITSPTPVNKPYTEQMRMDRVVHGSSTDTTTMDQCSTQA